MSDSDKDQDDADEQVFIRFFTRLQGDGNAAPTDKILVPKKLRRLGLSQLVNHLLGNQGAYFNSFSVKVRFCFCASFSRNFHVFLTWLFLHLAHLFGKYLTFLIS
jgi:hypothetical protein